MLVELPYAYTAKLLRHRARIRQPIAVRASALFDLREASIDDFPLVAEATAPAGTSRRPATTPYRMHEGRLHVPLRLVSFDIAMNARVNVLVCESGPVTHEGPFALDHEVSEVLVVTEPVDAAFPIHTEAVRTSFARRGGDSLAILDGEVGTTVAAVGD